MFPPLALALSLVLGVTHVAPADEPQPVNPQAAALGEFGERTRQYMDLHRKLAAQVPPMSENATSTEMERHQEGLARAIRMARSRARVGDIFTPPVVPLFRSAIRQDLRSRDVRDAMAAMQEVPVTLTLRVNEPWPPDAARATVPPRLLNNLYRLPEGLEYRFFGRHLVLVDSAANLIVDFITNVVPSMIRRR